MRILLDECVPKPLKREFYNFNIQTVRSGTKNGALLKLMLKEGFTVLLTSDQNIKNEQNLKQAGIAVIVMIAKTNRLADLILLKSKIIKTLSTIKPGELVEVSNY